MKTLLRLAALLLIASSCAKVTLKTPSSRFLSPEAKGELLAGNIDLSYQVGTKATITIEKDSDQIELSQGNADLILNAALGLTKNIDFFIYNYAESAPMIGIKYQFSGKPRSRAKEDDSSFAVTIAAGASQRSQTTDIDWFTEDPDGDETTAVIDQQLYDVSLIYGYRHSNDGLLYTSFQYSIHKASIEMANENDADINGMVRSYETANLGVSVGHIYYFNKLHLFKMESSIQQTNWSETKSKTLGFISAAWGLHW